MTTDTGYNPSTVLIMLGPLHFEHAGDADVLSVKIAAPDELERNLDQAHKLLGAECVENFHVVLKSSSISSLFDERVVSQFMDTLKPHAEVSVHVLGPEFAPVERADVDEIRYALVMAGLKMEQEGRPEGDESGWALQARNGDSLEQEEQVDVGGDDSNSEHTEGSDSEGRGR
mmetsp:Transcript_23985/g.55054  ORF Transcript_23985/g.55054 Transcript_23985/m.55054 type:complete len:173 (+) Transcript_23985:120-638(+)